MHMVSCTGVVRLLLVVSLVLAAGYASVGAQQPAPRADDSIDTVIAHYIAATKAGDWAASAAWMHPEALATFREMMMPVFLADTSGQAARTLLGTAELATVEKLGDREVFERFLRAMTSAVPQLAEALAGAEMTVIGNVAEGPDVVHVVYRAKASMQGLSLEQVQTMALKRYGDTWRLMLTGQVEGMAAALRAQFAK